MWCNAGIYKFNIHTHNLTMVDTSAVPFYPYSSHGPLTGEYDGPGQYVYQIKEYLYYWENRNGRTMKRYNIATNTFTIYNTKGNITGLSNGACIAGMVDANDFGNHLVYIHGGYNIRQLHVKIEPFISDEY